MGVESAWAVLAAALSVFCSSTLPLPYKGKEYPHTVWSYNTATAMKTDHKIYVHEHKTIQWNVTFIAPALGEISSAADIPREEQEGWE